MASPEAKIRMRTEAIRGLEYVAERAGNEEQVRDFTNHINQPTYGDFELRDIYILQGARDLLAAAAGVDLEEVDLSDESRIYEYRASDDKMHPSGEEPVGTEGPENPEGQLLRESSDDFQEPSDEELEESKSDSDLDLRELNPEEGVADDPQPEYEVEEDEEEAEAEEAEEAEESEASRKRSQF
jgi:hypothetical protein